jgi:hypothetical protein
MVRFALFSREKWDIEEENLSKEVNFNSANNPNQILS